MSVRCGNHHATHGNDPVYHADRESVRRCYNPNVETFLCGWLVQRGWTEDGEPIVVECGALATATERGWSCEAGHEHVTAEARHNEGWDYAHDEHEAKQLRGVGVQAVAMSGGSV